MRHVFRSILLAALVPARTLAQDSTVIDAGLYRVWQGSLEVFRETFRETRSAMEGTTQIPIQGITLRWRAERGGNAGLARARLGVHRISNDSLLRVYTLEAQGDSLRLEQADPGRQPRRWSRAAAPDALLPEQSIAALAALIHRAGGRDTVFRVWSPSADSTLSLSLTFRADSVIVAVATMRASASLDPGGRMRSMVIPIQAARAERFEGTELPPMRGLERPTPDYSAPAGARYTAEEVRVPVRPPAGDTFSLGCTLTRPLGARGRIPAAVTLTGSGLQDRDQNLWTLLPGYRPFRQVAERLAREGLAVLRCDDRGFGASTGRADSATTADFAADAEAAVAWLRSRPDVNPRRLALIGHSEGGMTGPIVAARDPALAALVIMAGPSKSLREVLRDQFAWRALAAPDLRPGERDTLLAELLRQADEFSDLPIPWMRWVRDWDPLPTARAVRAPVLILQGALDRQITAGQADTLGAAIRSGGNRDVTVRVFPRLNHLFLVSATDGSPTEYAGLADAALPAEVLDTLATWLVRRLRPAGRM